MKKYFVFVLLFITACQSAVVVPPEFAYKEIKAGKFTLASWQKISDINAPVKIYIEGDGRAFTSSGRVSANPTPRGTLVRKLAFGDNNPNVVYLARPCQFVKTPECSAKYWSEARFAPEVIESFAVAIKTLAQNKPVVLVGYSGGAQIAGLTSVIHPDKSLNLGDYKAEFRLIQQIHYVGEKDDIIPPKLAYEFTNNQSLIREVNGASHGSGWESIYPYIRAEY